MIKKAYFIILGLFFGSFLPSLAQTSPDVLQSGINDFEQAKEAKRNGNDSEMRKYCMSALDKFKGLSESGDSQAILMCFLISSKAYLQAESAWSEKAIIDLVWKEYPTFRSYDELKENKRKYKLDNMDLDEISEKLDHAAESEKGIIEKDIKKIEELIEKKQYQEGWDILKHIQNFVYFNQRTQPLIQECYDKLNQMTAEEYLAEAKEKASGRNYTEAINLLKLTQKLWPLEETTKLLKEYQDKYGEILKEKAVQEVEKGNYSVGNEIVVELKDILPPEKMLVFETQLEKLKVEDRKYFEKGFFLSGNFGQFSYASKPTAFAYNQFSLEFGVFMKKRGWVLIPFLSLNYGTSKNANFYYNNYGVELRGNSRYAFIDFGIKLAKRTTSHLLYGVFLGCSYWYYFVDNVKDQYGKDYHVMVKKSFEASALKPVIGFDFDYRIMPILAFSAQGQLVGMPKNQPIRTYQLSISINEEQVVVIEHWRAKNMVLLLMLGLKYYF